MLDSDDAIFFWQSRFDGFDSICDWLVAFQSVDW
jgi:hypothetical protein